MLGFHVGNLKTFVIIFRELTLVVKEYGARLTCLGCPVVSALVSATGSSNHSQI